MVKVAFVLCHDMLLSSLALPAEMLKAALAYQHAKGSRDAVLELYWVGETMEPVTTHTGLKLVPDKTLDDIHDITLVYLPALWRNPIKVMPKHPTIVPWLTRHIDNQAIVCAGGTGTSWLAETGCLDNKPATTHWHYFDAFQKRYPHVELKRQYFVTKADNLFCAGSINALADLTVYFIERFFGLQTSKHIESHFSQEVRQSMDQMSFFDGDTSRHQDEMMMQVQLWMHENFAQIVKIDELAAHFDMSVRTLNRRFKQAVGQSPMTYLQHLRLANARDLLKRSNLAIGEVAYRVGFQDSAYFSSIFKRQYNVSPSDFRQYVRKKLFHLGDIDK